MKLYVCSTYYHILISCLKSIENKDVSIMVTDYIPNADEIFENLKKNRLFNQVFYVKNISYEPKNKLKKVLTTKKN